MIRSIAPIWGDYDQIKCLINLWRCCIRSIAPIWGDYDEVVKLFFALYYFYQKHCPDLRGLRLIKFVVCAPLLTHQKHCPDLRGLRLQAVVHSFVVACCDQKHCPDLRGLRLTSGWSERLRHPIRSIAPIWGDYDMSSMTSDGIFWYQKHCPDLRGLRLFYLIQLSIYCLIRSIAPIWGDYDSQKTLGRYITSLIRSIAPIWGDYDIEYQPNTPNHHASEALPRFEGITTLFGICS